MLGMFTYKRGWFRHFPIHRHYFFPGKHKRTLFKKILKQTRNVTVASEWFKALCGQVYLPAEPNPGDTSKPGQAACFPRLQCIPIQDKSA